METKPRPNAQDAANRRIYHRPGVEHQYSGRTLNVSEGVTLLKYQSVFARRNVLDIGVGTGRTTGYLAPLARRYVAIDYSPVMVAEMRAKMPGVPVMLCDVRDLSAFQDREFDFVFGSSCVLDALPPEGRIQALNEIHRVLRIGGTLIFSSHNRRVRPELRTPHIAWSRNPVDSAAQMVRLARKLWRKARLSRSQTEEPDYAIYCDEDHDYACLHYYIDQQSQREQLARHGFRVVDVIDTEGQVLDSKEFAPNSSWLMYVATCVQQAAQAGLDKAA